MNDFWVIACFYNPAGFQTLRRNYEIFANKIRSQGAKLLTVELAFGTDEFQLPDLADREIKIRGSSVMWQKERLINHGVSLLPDDVKSFAWVDCDVLFLDDTWVEQAQQKLETNDIVQLFKKVYYLPPGHTSWQGQHETLLQSVVWQNKIHKHWLERRKKKLLPFSAPGFAWAANRKAFPKGIYDKNIIGSGDTFLVDCLLGSWEIHGFASKFNQAMKNDMQAWNSELTIGQAYPSGAFKTDYIPVDIAHLWHGRLKNRQYMDRHEIIRQHDYDPLTDIRLENGVYEWNSDKRPMHDAIKQYFFERQEDSV